MGLVEDRDTDGHVDLIAAVHRSPARCCCRRSAPDNPNYDNCTENARVSRDAGIEVIELAAPARTPTVAGEPVAGELPQLLHLQWRRDRAGRGRTIPTSRRCEIIARCYPDREVVAVPGLVLAFGGGGPHCITQQVPVRTWLKHQQLLTAYPPPPSPARTATARARAAAARPRAGALARLDPTSTEAALARGIRMAAAEGARDRLPAGADAVAVLRDHA